MPTWNNPYAPSVPIQTYQSNGAVAYSNAPSYYNQYQQMYANQAPQPMPMQQQQMSMANEQPKKMRVKWVGGVVEAHASSVDPDEMLVMLDSNNAKMYFKSADSNGRVSPLMVSDYTNPVIVDQNAGTGNVDTSQFATKDDFNQLKKMLEDLTAPGKKNG